MRHGQAYLMNTSIPYPNPNSDHCTTGPAETDVRVREGYGLVTSQPSLPPPPMPEANSEI